jgi:hypothetical protein
LEAGNRIMIFFFFGLTLDFNFILHICRPQLIIFLKHMTMTTVQLLNNAPWKRMNGAIDTGLGCYSPSTITRLLLVWHNAKAPIHLPLLRIRIFIAICLMKIKTI